MNPLVKHPLLNFLDYDQMKNPTLEGIRAALEKKRKNIVRMAYGNGALYIVIALNSFIIMTFRQPSAIWKILYGSFMIVFVAGGWLMARTMIRESKKYLMPDEDILEEIRKHREWAEASEAPERNDSAEEPQGTVG